MNKKSLLTLLVLTSLVGCGTKTSSSTSSSVSTPSSPIISTSSEASSSSINESSSNEVSSSSNESTSSSEVSSSSTNESTSSSEVSSSSTGDSSSSSSVAVPMDSKIVLDEIQQGFKAQSIYSKKYNNSSASKTLLRTYVGEGVARWEYFTKSSWSSVTESTSPYKFEQYECDANEDAQKVTYDSAGKVIYEPLLLKDAISGENVEAFWSETKLDNAFASFDKDDFITYDQVKYELDLSEEALKDSSYKTAVESLAIQMYMILEGTEQVGFHFVDTPLDSYTITVDENNKPVSYEAKFEDVEQPDGWGGTDIVHTSVSGTFEILGSSAISKATTLETKYEELDQVFESLKKHNYEFNVVREEEGDGWYTSDSTQTIVGKSDGLGNFETHYVNDDIYNQKDEYFGYSQLSETTYRKYLVGENTNVWCGDEKEGSALSLLPSFLFSSALFIKNEESSTDTLTVYNYDKPALLNSNYSLDTSIIDFGFDSIQGWLLVDLTIEVSEDKVVFKNNTSDVRKLEATFTKIGEVEAMGAVVINPKDLLSGTFSSTQKVKGTSITLDVEVDSDKVAISKDNELFGEYTYTVDEDNNIVLDSSVEGVKFTVTETVGAGATQSTTIYTCNFVRTVEIDNIFDPTALIFEISMVKAGQTWSNSVSFSLEKVVPPTYYFEFTLPDWNPAAEAPKLYYWGTDADGEFIDNAITWDADGLSNMTLKEGNTYYYEIDASITLTGIIIAFEQDGQFKQSVDVTEGLPTEAGKYSIVSTYSDWSTGKFDGVTISQITE